MRALGIVVGLALVTGAIATKDGVAAFFMLTCGMALLVGAVIAFAADGRERRTPPARTVALQQAPPPVAPPVPPVVVPVVVRDVVPEAQPRAVPPRASAAPPKAAPPKVAPPKVAPPSARQSERPAQRPEIVTRTTQSTGTALVDPFADTEREWSADELRRALASLDVGMKIEEIAARMSIDQRQVAIKLVRTIFGVTGLIDDESKAPNFGSRYSAEEERLLVELFRSGARLEEIARSLGRSPLGAGWRLLNLRPQVVFSTR